MQLFYYNIPESSVSALNLPVSLRVAYLIADTPVCTLMMDFMIRRQYQLETDFVVKEALVLGAEDKNDPEMAARLRLMRDQVKVIRRKKIKDRAAIVVIKQYERTIEQFFMTSQAEVYEKMRSMGIAQLDELPHDAIRHYRIHNATPELSERDHVPASEVLQLLGDSHDRAQQATDITFMLPCEAVLPPRTPFPLAFFEDLFPEHAEAGGPPIPPPADEEPDDQRAWATLLFRMPNPLFMEAAELQAVRSQLSGPGAPFRCAFDAWIKGCVHDGWSAAQSAAHYAGVVRPATRALSEAIGQNKVLAHAQAAMVKHHEGGADIHAACIPLRGLWAFWEQMGALESDTLDKLRAADEARGGIRVPVLIVTPPAAPKPDAEAPPLASRRTLDLS